MKEYFLSYYPKFKCVAGKCKHTCCAGWEVNIDNQSLTHYKNCVGEFSRMLNRGIDFKKRRFKLDKSKRCAFLNDKGLCDLIINLGEKSLCQVCRDHPRFRSFFNDRTETGLGFCCEEATRIVLSFDDKIEPILLSDDGGMTEPDFNQKNVLKFRENALEILQDRSVSVNDRIKTLLKASNAELSAHDIKKITKTFLSFERVDKSWIKRLKNLKNAFSMTTKDDLSLYAERFLINGLYRHLSDAEDTVSVRARTIAVVISWWVINAVIESERTENANLFELVVDAVRSFSVEVEYSQNNLNKLFAIAYKLIKI